MKNNNNKSENSLRSFTTLAIVIASSLVLASCGGGDGSSAAAPDATSMAVTSGGTVPAGWTGRAPKYEVINGITVPPEPSPTLNNATLAGVDVNNNGVRDDVERVLAKKWPSKYQESIKYAIDLQRTILNKTQYTKTEEKEVFCFIAENPDIENEVNSIQMNNSNRHDAYAKNIDPQSYYSCK